MLLGSLELWTCTLNPSMCTRTVKALRGFSPFFSFSLSVCASACLEIAATVAEISELWVKTSSLPAARPSSRFHSRLSFPIAHVTPSSLN
uniref:Uncharacterized protein n=1 Tax=Physcomitrium patens TaxID=3218 RepID=A0A2K1JDK4_PHYPA|nr:hypothetical protein PHYPA_019886 [Physcomitrium patens]